MHQKLVEVKFDFSDIKYYIRDPISAIYFVVMILLLIWTFKEVFLK